MTNAKHTNKDSKEFSVFLRCTTKAADETSQWFDWAIIQLLNNNKTPLLAWLTVVRQDKSILKGLELMGVELELKPTNTGFKSYDKNDIVANYNVKKVNKKAGIFTFESMLQVLTERKEAESKVLDSKKELEKKAKKAKKARAQRDALQALQDASNISNETVKKAVLDNAKKEFKKPKIDKLINDLTALEVWVYDLELNEQRELLVMLYSATQAVLEASGEEEGEFTLTTDLSGTKQGIAH
jgi:hypothetical protein